MTRFLVENLVSHPDGSSPKGINTRSLSLDIAATGVAHWLVTHDSGFNPKSITDPAPTPAGSSWTSGDPTGKQNYTLPDSVVEGAVTTLYLWVAVTGGKFKQGATATESNDGNAFTLDTTGPTLTAVAIPAPSDLLVGKTDASFNLTVSGTDTYTKYEYCFGQGCSVFQTLSGVTDATSISVDESASLLAGLNYVSFRLSDWLGNTSGVVSESFTLTDCIAGDTVTDSTPVFQHGSRTRTCDSSGSWEADWVVACDDDYHENTATKECESDSRACPDDEAHFLPSGATAGTQSWSSEGSWEACVATTCVVATHSFHSGVCYAKSQSCDFKVSVDGSNVKAGKGQQAYTSGSPGDYEDCQATSCLSGWVLENSACRAPAQGKYVDDGSQEQDCSTTGFLSLPSDGGDSFITPTGGMTKEQACDFTCTSGNTRINIAGSTRECKVGGPGTYELDDSGTQNCWADGSTITAELDTRGATAWAMNQADVKAAENCQVAGCKAANQALNAGETKCTDLTSGQYKNPRDHTEAPCGTIAHAGSGASWAADQSGVTSADACKIACATDAGNHLGADTTGADATCEQQCSPTHAPADSGRKAWISGNWSTTCKPTVCNAGYDDHAGNDTCEKTEAGFYASGSDRKDRQQCTVRYIDKKAKPASQNAVWSLAESTPLAVSAHTCRWDCKRGYEENLQGTDCVLKVPRVIAFGIGNAKNIGNGRWGVKTRQLNLQVAETHVSYYYVTHESTFNPSLGAKKR